MSSNALFGRSLFLGGITHADAQFYLAILYRNGQGVTQSNEAAVEYREYSIQGLLWAQSDPMKRAKIGAIRDIQAMLSSRDRMLVPKWTIPNVSVHGCWLLAHHRSNRTL